MARLELTRLGVAFAGPVVLASGPVGFGLELASVGDMGRLGALTTKTITRLPRAGNPAPRLADAPAGTLNSVGLTNPGLEAFRERILPKLQDLGTRIIVSFAAADEEEAGWIAQELGRTEGIDALELNLSCPNVEGTRPALEAGMTFRWVRACTDQTLPLLAKLSPDSQDIVGVAEAALRGGAAGLTVGNTIQGTRIDWNTGLPVFARVFGGLSGPALLPVALAKVFALRAALPGVPIVGTGGVTSLGAMLEMAMAGADLVGVGTGAMVDPDLPWRLTAELETWLVGREIARYETIISCAHRGGLAVVHGT